MQLRETRKALNNFAKYVIKQARTNLTKSKKNSTKKLYNSLDYNINVSKDSINVIFEMEDYGQFQDQGVSGKKTKYNTPFSYKTKMPPAKSFSEWVIRKRLKGIRDKQGRFLPRKSLQYLIARSVFTKGIKPSMFFTKPFETGFARLPKELQEKFGIDIENAI